MRVFGAFVCLSGHYCIYMNSEIAPNVYIPLAISQIALFWFIFNLPFVVLTLNFFFNCKFLWHLFTTRVRSMREGNVLTRVCVSVHTPKGTPILSDQRGTSILQNGGYPILPVRGDGGGLTPSQVRKGVPPSFKTGGTPSFLSERMRGGYTIPGQERGTPIPGLDGGYPNPRSGQGYPHHRSRWGVPQSKVKTGVTHHRSGWGLPQSTPQSRSGSRSGQGGAPTGTP